jgi:hypothetical protein
MFAKILRNQLSRGGSNFGICASASAFGCLPWRIGRKKRQPKCLTNDLG